jgi:hypothetical protein
MRLVGASIGELGAKLGGRFAGEMRRQHDA